MKIVRTEGFKKDFKQLPKSVQEKFGKKFRLFMENIKTSFSQG